jgi:hypothetical protein
LRSFAHKVIAQFNQFFPLMVWLEKKLSPVEMVQLQNFDLESTQSPNNRRPCILFKTGVTEFSISL